MGNGHIWHEITRCRPA